MDYTAALAQVKATQRAGFMSQNFVKLMCSYAPRVRMTYAKELFRGTFRSADLMFVPCGSAALVVVLKKDTFLEPGTLARVYFNHLLFKGDSKMDKRGQELLDKQLWGVGPSPLHSGIIIGFITVFLVGIGVGDILSKTKQVNTPSTYAALNFFPNGKE